MFGSRRTQVVRIWFPILLLVSAGRVVLKARASRRGLGVRSASTTLSPTTSQSRVKKDLRSGPTVVTASALHRVSHIPHTTRSWALILQSWSASGPTLGLEIAFYLTARTDRFLMVLKESILTPQGGLGGIRTESGQNPGESGFQWG